MNHPLLMSKFMSAKCMMTVIMFVQAMSAAELAFMSYSHLYDNREKDKANAAKTALDMLAYARFFSESCGWCALALRRLRYEESKDMHDYLTRNKPLIDALYNLRTTVNHVYNEDLADVYRKGTYKKDIHQEKLAFNFSSCKDGVSFRIGTIEVNMISQLASMKKLEDELLAMK